MHVFARGLDTTAGDISGRIKSEQLACAIRRRGE